MNLKTIAFAGLLYFFPTEIAYAKPKPLEDELKELAELAMKCGSKFSYKRYDIQNGIPVSYAVDGYLLSIPTPDPLSRLPFIDQIYVNFYDGSFQNSPDQTINQEDNFEIIGGEAGYFRCAFKHKGNILRRTCTSPFIDDLLEARIRRAIEFIKKNVSPECYGNIV